MTRTLDVDLTDPQLYTEGFPHGVFTELRQRGRYTFTPRSRGVWVSRRFPSGQS